MARHHIATPVKGMRACKTADFLLEKNLGLEVYEVTMKKMNILRHVYCVATPSRGGASIEERQQFPTFPAHLAASHAASPCLALQGANKFFTLAMRPVQSLTLELVMALLTHGISTALILCILPNVKKLYSTHILCMLQKEHFPLQTLKSQASTSSEEAVYPKACHAKKS